MDIRGLLPFSLIDYPGKITAVAFAGGCNMQCPFCHNPCLALDPESQPQITEERFFAFLESRRNRLDGVVFSGGEPTIYPDLVEWIARTKALGFSVKLDTNGSNPTMLAGLLENRLLDAVGVDYKMPTGKYHILGHIDFSTQIIASLHILQHADILLDVRTTIHPALHTPEDIRLMHAELRQIGISQWTLQQFHVVETLDPNLPAIPAYTDRQLFQIANGLDGDVRVRGLHGKEFSHAM